MVITSIENSKLKLVRALKEKKFRDEYSKYIIEGYRVVKDSLPYLTDAELIMSESSYEKYYDEFCNYDIVIVSNLIFSKLCDTNNNQGILCVANQKINTLNYDARYALFLDRIRDPGNMGTIIRSALATGFNDVYCYDCVDFYNPKVVRSAMSAIARVNVYKTLETTPKFLKNNGYTIFSADMRGKTVFDGISPREKTCLCIGNEANGLSDEILAVSDAILCLPMLGGESLNAGVSASVMMYQFAFGNKI